MRLSSVLSGDPRRGPAPRRPPNRGRGGMAEQTSPRRSAASTASPARRRGVSERCGRGTIGICALGLAGCNRVAGPAPVPGLWSPRDHRSTRPEVTGDSRDSRRRWGGRRPPDDGPNPHSAIARGRMYPRPSQWSYVSTCAATCGHCAPPRSCSADPASRASSLVGASARANSREIRLLVEGDDSSIVAAGEEGPPSPSSESPKRPRRPAHWTGSSTGSTTRCRDPADAALRAGQEAESNVGPRR